MTIDRSTQLSLLMQQAVNFSIGHVHSGGIPFTAFIVDNKGVIIGRGVNRVREHHDPTAHAEVEAIRDACRTSGVTSLHGTILLASGEPCAMCYMSALYAGVSQVFFAVDRDEAANHGFDYRGGYKAFAIDPQDWQFPVVKRLGVAEGLKPFLAYHTRSGLS
ncbi:MULTISPECIES: nucleoside deaminase [Psychrobacter]|uniref:nucleoside deaminase n=1 Tax=Psychrobacter TaxID=497 RepID=UPI003FD1F2CD